jgi:hypothetical protein
MADKQAAAGGGGRGKGQGKKAKKKPRQSTSAKVSKEARQGYMAKAVVRLSALAESVGRALLPVQAMRT